MKRIALLGILMLTGCVSMRRFDAAKAESASWQKKAEEFEKGQGFLDAAYSELRAKYDSCAKFHRAWERGLRTAGVDK
jgi:hypothetical protein